MIRVGTAGWSYADWEGTVYPRSKPPGFHALQYLAPFMSTVEINSSFYAIPPERNAAAWVQRVRDHPDFRFTAKLFRGFTHDEPESRERMQAMCDDYRRGVEPLRSAGRLGGVLAQFPASYRPGPRAWRRLEWICDQFSGLGLIAEVRHLAWFEPPALRRLEALPLSVACIDLPAAPEHPTLETPTPGPVGYLRLHGRNSAAWFDAKAHRDQKYDYLYGSDEIRAMVATAKRLATGRDQTYVITNNHFSGKALANAIQIQSGLDGERTTAPANLYDAYPALADGWDRAGQNELFS